MPPRSGVWKDPKKGFTRASHQRLLQITPLSYVPLRMGGRLMRRSTGSLPLVQSCATHEGATSPIY